MRAARVTAVFIAVHLAAAGCLVYLVMHYALAPLFGWPALLWLALSLIASYSVIRTVGGGVPHNISVGFTVSGAIIVLFNPLVAAILVSLGTLDERDFSRKRSWRDTLGNRSMFLVCATVGSLVYNRLSLVDAGAFDPAVLMARISVLVLVYFLVNSCLVHVVVSALNDEPFLRHYPFKGDLLMGYLFQGVLAMILVLVARQHQALTILIVAPLWGVRFSLEKIVELREMNEQLVHSFADALDLRDHETAGHTRRVATLARLIGRQLGLSRRELDDIYAAGSLHDLGKIGIPERVLDNRGSLSDQDWGLIHTHPELGARIIDPVPALAGTAALIRACHEHWDGSGYPHGLRGEQIPLGARVVFTCDAYHAMREHRPYQPSLSAEEARHRLEQLAGKHFDPAVVAALLAHLDAGGVEHPPPARA